MKRRIVSFALALVLVFGLSVTASAATTKQNRAAEALYHLELFRGTSSTAKVFDLDNGLNRAAGTLTVIRLLGKETETSAYDVANTPFTDVADFWTGINQFIAYAYETGLVKGMTLTTFEPTTAMSDRMFLTLVLRVLGYQDGNNNYVWENAYRLAHQAGLVDSTEPDANFTRGDAVLVAWKAMGVKLQGSNKTLAQKLISEGVFTAAEYAEAKEIWNYGYIFSDVVTPGGSENTGSGDTGNTGTTTPDSGNTETGNVGSATTPEGEKALTDYTYEEYQAMSGAEQQVFMMQFESIPAFFEWHNAAKAAYDAAHPSIEIGGDTVIDLGDLANG